MIKSLAEMLSNNCRQRHIWVRRLPISFSTSLSALSANTLFTRVLAGNFFPLFRYKNTIKRTTAGDAKDSSFIDP